MARFFRIVGGHPYLVRRGLYEMVDEGPEAFCARGTVGSRRGAVRRPLAAALISLMQDPNCATSCAACAGKPCPTPDSFYRLRSAGLVSGDSARDVRPRCHALCHIPGKAFLVGAGAQEKIDQLLALWTRIPPL